jgi:endonuclease/exonuclease/phosphatase family metal-dependent hydrolase
MRFRFASWNVNNRLLKEGHLDLLQLIRPDLIAFQEVSSSFYSSLTDRGLFAWSVSSLSLRPPPIGEGRSRALGCAIFGGSSFHLLSSSLLPDLDFPERTLAVRVRGTVVPLTVCSFHIPPGASWGAVKPKTMRSIADWLAHLQGNVIVGIDANAPKIDHPDLGSNTWWWKDEPLLLGAKPIHHLRDALRSYLQDRPDEFASIAASRPTGPLALSHIRGNKHKRTECRYDFVYHTPGISVESISYLYEEALAAGSDHAVVTAELRAGDD